MVILITCKNEEVPIKNEGIESPQHYTYYFSDAQGQLTPESVVVSGRNSNSFKLSCMSSLPARMKMIQSKMKELEWSQHFSIISLWGFSRRSRAANSAVHGPIWLNFELVRDVMVFLITCKNEEDSIKK